jgi:ligand-binding SRPBCC domain-containing protein
MSIYSLRREQFIPGPLEEVFHFFSDAANLQAITPAFLDFQILTPRPIEIQQGTLLDYKLKWHGIPISWKTRIIEWNPPHGFVDVQLKGPYKLWRHAHAFSSVNGGTSMLDSLDYELPFGILGQIAHDLKVRRDLEGIFDYRRQQIARIFPPALKR